MSIDKRAVRIQVSAEEARRTEENRVELQHKREQLRIQRQRQELFLKEERQQARENARRKRQIQRQQARQKFAGRVESLIPTIGRRMMITVPIVAPMTVAWIGQISFAMETLGWIFIGALIFAAAWELTTAFAGWMYHQARKAGDRGTIFRVATWVFAMSAGAMNYWHACPVITERLNAQTIRHHIDLAPNPKAVSYGAMSLVGIALWELYSSLIHRKHLRAEGKVSSPRPRFGILRWLRFPRITWHAWSLSVRYSIQTVDEAWSAAVTEVERKRREKDNRPEVRVTIVRTVTRTYATPASATTSPLYRIERPVGFWDLDPAPTTERPAVATTPARGLPAPATTDQATTNDHPQATSDQATATTTATTRNDHQSERSDDHQRPRPTTTRKTGRAQVVADQTKAQPTAEDNKAAVTAYLDSVKAGRPLSQRALAKQFGFSKTWARDRIQEAGPQPVGGGRRMNDRPTTTTPKDHPATGEVKTG